MANLPVHYEDDEWALRSKIGELAYDLKLAGWSWPRLFTFLADRVGGHKHHRETVELIKDCYREELRSRREIVKKVDDLRQIEVDRLDRMLLALDPSIQEGDFKAITTAHRIIETRINILGIRPPKRVEVDYIEQTSVDKEIDRILRDMKDTGVIDDEIVDE